MIRKYRVQGSQESRGQGEKIKKKGAKVPRFQGSEELREKLFDWISPKTLEKIGFLNNSLLVFTLVSLAP